MMEDSLARISPLAPSEPATDALEQCEGGSPPLPRVKLAFEG